MVIKGFDMSSAVHASTGHHQLVRAKCVKVGGSNINYLLTNCYLLPPTLRNLVNINYSESSFKLVYTYNNIMSTANLAYYLLNMLLKNKK